ncbi:MAG: flagellar basal body-associated FliL family protein [Eubacteriales bacterium]|nr:flagellar basal body-associated FliL family protein [Eubacteriales bacterium]
MKKNKVGIILIIVLLIALLISFVVGFFLLLNTMKKGDSTAELTPIVVEEKVDRKDIAIFPIGESAIITNLLEGPDGKKHVIKVKVNLGINASKDNKKEADELIQTLTAQTFFLEDTILGICRNKTYEELKRNDAQELLADEIHLKLSEAFDTKLIEEVIINQLLFD